MKLLLSSRRTPVDVYTVALPESGTNALPIVITKLGKGQEIDIICKAYKVRSTVPLVLGRMPELTVDLR